MTNDQVDILVVDDDELTAEMIERSLRKFGDTYRVIPAEDGKAALDMLQGKGVAKVRRPFLVLLDLNMPRMNGFEFLEAIRGDHNLASSVIFVLTTSDTDSDRSRAYDEQVAGYIVKASAGSQFSKVAALLSDIQSTVHLPM